MLIYLVRHWQTQANVDEVCSWQIETPLTELGISQAQATWQTLRWITFDAILSSDLSRAYDTAAFITWDQDTITTTLLRERCYYSYEWTNWLVQQHAEELWLIPSRYWELWWNRPNHPIENNEEMIWRRDQFIEEHIKDKEYQNVLIASHGSFLRCIMANILQLQLGEKWVSEFLSPMSNCAINIIEYRPEQWLRLVTYNQYLHLLNLK